MIKPSYLYIVVKYPGVGGGGGHSHRKVVQRCSTLKTLLFRPLFSYRDIFFSNLFLARETPFIFFENKYCIVKTNFCRFWFNFSHERNSSKTLFRRPQSRVKNQFQRPNFENLGGTYVPKFLSNISPEQNKSKIQRPIEKTANGPGTIIVMHLLSDK